MSDVAPRIMPMLTRTIAESPTSHINYASALAACCCNALDLQRVPQFVNSCGVLLLLAGIVAAHFPDDPAANGMAPGGRHTRSTA